MRKHNGKWVARLSVCIALKDKADALLAESIPRSCIQAVGGKTLFLKVNEMTKEELAAMLDGREIGDEITKEEAETASENGLVVVFGYSDDSMEFRGAIDEEVSCFDGGIAYLKNGHFLANKCDDERCPYFNALLQTAVTIEAVWHDTGSPCWTYKTDIPYVEFKIMEDGEEYCRGIVFSRHDVGSKGTRHA
ncbi:MAG: hypothetical protein LUC93_05575 [Planctomycetaceae bacterium]|nr:hypothetical protein [Planctomycetaceae bacterium]